MRSFLLFLSIASTSLLANELSLDTLRFASDNTVAREFAKCEVIHEKMYGVTEISGKFKTYALLKMADEGFEKKLTSYQLTEYMFGYEYNKNFWRGWFSAIALTSDEISEQIMPKMYDESKCAEYISTP